MGRQDRTPQRHQVDAAEGTRFREDLFPADGRSADADTLDRANRRLHHLYDVSKLLAQFDGSEAAILRVFDQLGEAVAAHVLVLVLGGRGDSEPVTIEWHRDSVDAAQLEAAQARARSAFSYLRRSAEARVGPTSKPFVALPLVVAGGHVFGAVGAEAKHSFDETSLLLLDAVTHQLAVAVDRQQRVALNRAVMVELQRSEQLQRFLAETSAAFAASLDSRVTLAIIARSAVPLFADLCIVDELGKADRAQRVEVIFADPTKAHYAERLRELEPPPDSDSPRARVLRTGQSLLIPGSVSNHADLGHSSAEGTLLAEMGVVCMMVVPLRVRGRIVGIITFASIESSRQYTHADLAFAEEISARAALAIDNARLYEGVQHAVRVRDELLAVVSHDLRNALHSVLLALGYLLGTVPGAHDRRTRGRRVLESAQRAATRMQRLIADLVDLGSIESGHLAIEREHHQVKGIVDDAIDAHRSAAQAKGLRLEGDVPDDICGIFCDRGRILQVLGNLIGNAIKFTKQGGVTVRVVQRGGAIELAVHDTGPGMPPDELPHVFDRYWQASKTARLGTGLGLSIVKGLVEAHAGRVWATSEVGVGTTFFITFPCDPHSDLTP